MSMTIDSCPWCGRDFMYDANDLHLRRYETDPGTGNQVYRVICQYCHEAQFKPVYNNPGGRRGIFHWKNFKRANGIWINLWLVCLYISWNPTVIIVLRIIMFSDVSGVFTFKFSLWGDQQLSFGINKFILLWLYDHLWLAPKRYLARMRG